MLEIKSFLDFLRKTDSPPCIQEGSWKAEFVTVMPRRVMCVHCISLCLRHIFTHSTPLSI